MNEAYFQAGRKVKANPLYHYENSHGLKCTQKPPPSLVANLNMASPGYHVVSPLEGAEMKPGIRPGLEHELVRRVTPDRTVLQKRTTPVFATAEMVKLMEFAAYKALEPFYEDHESSVGVHVEVRHLAATPLGMTVRAVNQPSLRIHRSKMPKPFDSPEMKPLVESGASQTVRSITAWMNGRACRGGGYAL